MTTIAALVPMRHHSQRVPGKNYRMLAGQPLYCHILHTLQQVPQISMIAVDTDSPEITAGLGRGFPQVQLLPRPPELCRDDVPMNEILLYDTSRIKADFYLQTHSTNPLIRPATIELAIRTLLEAFPRYDSLFSVTPLQTRLWDADGRPVNHDPAVLLQTQDLPPIYEENSCIYIFTRRTLLERRNRLGERPLMFAIDPAEAWDIDDEIDFSITEFLFSQRQGGSEKG